MYLHQRSNWEFFAVLSGTCALVLNESQKPQLFQHRLWVLPPQTAHGWFSRHKKCEVAIFHFSTVPDALARRALDSGHLEIPLSADQRSEIRNLAASLIPDYERMTERSLLVFEKALIDLSLTVLDACSGGHPDPVSEYALHKVEACLAWYTEHMYRQPKLDEAAAAVHVSPRHLRRLFAEAKKENPLAAFTELRIRRVMELLADAGRSIDAIAAECGFSSGSDLCRVFKKSRNISPLAWRKKLLRECGEKKHRGT